MMNNDFFKSIETTFKKALEILRQKNQDYASKQDPFRNFRYAQYCGVTVEKAILVRISDKFARINNLIDKSENERAVKDESINDTCRDMINYLAILVAYLEEKRH